MQERKDSDRSLDQVVEHVVKDIVMEHLSQDITLEKAVKMIDLVVQKAASLHMKVVVAIHNKSGRPVAVHCMDDAYIASYDIAINKAYTSVALKMSTSNLKQLSMPGGSLYGIQHTNEGKIVIFGGGEPLLFKEQVIGGIGVSGGTEEQDSMLAEYGKHMFEEVVQWQ